MVINLKDRKSWRKKRREQLRQYPWEPSKSEWELLPNALAVAGSFVIVFIWIGALIVMEVVK